MHGVDQACRWPCLGGEQLDPVGGALLLGELLDIGLYFSWNCSR